MLKDFPENSVAVVMCIRDNLKFFKLAFHSVISFTSHPYHFVIVDNMSSLSTKSYLKRLQNNHAFHVIPYPNEFNYAAQLNLGFNYSFTFPPIKYGLAIHSDAVVEPNWLNKLLLKIARDAKCGALFPSQGDHWLLFKRESYAAVGGFDEKYHSHSFVLRDFANRIEKTGFSSQEEQDINIHHFMQTSMREGIVTVNHYDEDKKLYYSKFKEAANESK